MYICFGKLTAKYLIGIVVLFSATNTIYAQDNNLLQLQRYVESAESKTSLLSVGQYWHQQLLKQEPHCNKFSVDTINRIRPLAEVTFEDQRPYPTAGLWIVDFTLKTCVNYKRYSVFVTAGPSSAPRVSPLIPGDSKLGILALSTFVENGIPEFLEYKEFDTTECQMAQVFDSRVAGEYAKALPQWQEIWQLQHCGNVVEMQVCFRRDADEQISWKFAECAIG